MRLYSILLSITMLAGALRFSGISLIDEIAFLVLFVVLIFYRNNKSQSSQRCHVSKSYSRAVFSFRLLFIYLIFSLCYGLLSDQYFGKIRWFVILIAFVASDSAVLFYLGRRLRKINSLRYIYKVYNYVFAFVVVYILYGLVAKYLFDIEPGNLQDAQATVTFAPKWYAIWGTTVYTSIIFLPFLLFNKVLRINGYLSRIRFLSAYAATITAAVFYDSRVMLLMLLAFFSAELLRFKTRYKIIIFPIIALLVIGFGANFMSTSLSSTGGFLFTLLSDDTGSQSTGDFDRIAHYIAAYKVLTNSLTETLIGTGFLNSGKAIIPAYISVYTEFGITMGPASNNLSGVSMGTFGLSAFLIENGIIGAFLFTVHLYNLCMVARKTPVIVPSVFIIITYGALLLIFFAIYINDNMLFYLMLSPSIFLYPLIKSNRSNTEQEFKTNH